MEYFSYLKLSLILPLICMHSLVNGLNESVLVIAISHVSGGVSWDRGDEILPGAIEAVNNINQQSGSNKLTLLTANSGQVVSSNNPYSGNVLEVIANLTLQNVRIIGVAGLLHPDILAILQSSQLLIASLVDFNGKVSSSNVIYMTASSSTVIDSFLAFMKVNSQARIGIITEINNSFHLRFLHSILSKVNVSFNIPIVLGHHQESLASIINTIVSSNVYIIVLNVSPFLVPTIMCEAYKNELTWPKYAWILHSYRFDDIPHTFNIECSIGTCNILEGMFVLQLIQEEMSKLERNTNRSKSSPYTYLLHEAVWEITLAANVSSISNLSHNALPSKHIYIYQVVNGTSAHVGVYNSNSRRLENLTLGTFINSNLPVIRLLPSSYFLSLPALCFVLNTVLLVLFVYFRNEPSVKSTSVCLSLLIFTGCYILIAYTILAIADIPPKIDLCMILVWLSGLGISMPLILTTLLVKMLRVYRIFTLYKRVKPKAHTSECAHFLYTIAILSPNIAILIFWTLIDPNYTENTYVEHPGFIIIEQRCKSDYAFVWFLLLLVYSLILSIAIVTVAIISRKIRLAQFKDTKKVNFLIFTILFIGISGLAYSSIFASIREYFFVSTYILYFGHIVIAFLCPITLFVPKVWPPLAARISKDDNRSTHTYKDSSVHSVISIVKYQVNNPPMIN